MRQTDQIGGAATGASVGAVLGGGAGLFAGLGDEVHLNLAYCWLPAPPAQMWA